MKTALSSTSALIAVIGLALEFSCAGLKPSVLPEWESKVHLETKDGKRVETAFLVPNSNTLVTACFGETNKDAIHVAIPAGERRNVSVDHGCSAGMGIQILEVAGATVAGPQLIGREELKAGFKVYSKNGKNRHVHTVGAKNEEVFSISKEGQGMETGKTLFAPDGRIAGFVVRRDGKIWIANPSIIDGIRASLIKKPLAIEVHVKEPETKPIDPPMRRPVAPKATKIEPVIPPEKIEKAETTASGCNQCGNLADHLRLYSDGDFELMVPKLWTMHRKTLPFNQENMQGSFRVINFQPNGGETGTSLDLLDRGMRIIRLKADAGVEWDADLMASMMVKMPTMLKALHPGAVVEHQEALKLARGGAGVLTVLREGSMYLVMISAPADRGVVVGEFPVSPSDVKEGSIFAALFAASYQAK